MMKKRIKRALRAIGLMKPHQGSEPTKRHHLNLAQARSIATELHRVVLLRDPQIEERDRYAGLLASGELSVSGMVKALLESGEFGTVFSRQPSVASVLSMTVLGTLARVTDDAAVRAYASGLMGSLPVSDFLREICESPEFRSTWGIGGAGPGAFAGHAGHASAGSHASSRIPAVLPGDLAAMIEEMIAARLIADGAIIGLPPIPAHDRPPVPAAKIVSLIRTLDMLADRPPGPQSAPSAQAASRAAEA